jgi:hypothetical protein
LINWLDPATTIVRVSAGGTTHQAADLDALEATNDRQAWTKSQVDVIAEWSVIA